MSYPVGTWVPFEFYFTYLGQPVLGQALNVTLDDVLRDSDSIGALTPGVHYIAFEEQGHGWYKTKLHPTKTMQRGEYRAVAHVSVAADLVYDYCIHHVGPDLADVVWISGDEATAGELYNTIWGLMAGNVASATPTTLSPEPGILTDLPVVGCVLQITAGPGQGQQRLVVEFTDGIFTVDRPWSVEPDVTSAWKLLPANVGRLSTSLLTQSDVVAISEDSDVATNLKKVLDGTGGVALAAKSLSLSNPDGTPALAITSTTGRAVEIISLDNTSLFVQAGNGDAINAVASGGAAVSLQSVDSNGLQVFGSGNGIYASGETAVVLEGSDGYGVLAGGTEAGMRVTGATGAEIESNTTDPDGTGLRVAGVGEGPDIDADITGTISSFPQISPAEIRQEMDANSTKLAHLDVSVSSRLASANYTAPVVPDNESIAAIKSQTDKIQFVGSDIKSTLDGEIVSVDPENFPMDLDAIVEGDYTLRDLIRLVVAHTFGKASGGGTSTLRFRDLDDTKDRLVITVGRKGDRTAVSYDPS